MRLQPQRKLLFDSAKAAPHRFMLDFRLRCAAVFLPWVRAFPLRGTAPSRLAGTWTARGGCPPCPDRVIARVSKICAGRVRAATCRLLSSCARKWACARS